MKKLILLITVLLFLPVTSQTIYAKADNFYEYRRIITDDTPFYTDAGGINLLFYLPYTYYVKLIEQGEVLSHVEIYGQNGIAVMDGYAPTSSLFRDDLTVENPYPYLTLKTLDTAVLYQDKSLTESVCYVFPERNMVYLGQITDPVGKYYYYVSYNNRLGYISEESVAPFTLPNHPNELTFITPDPPAEQPTKPQEQTSNDFFSLKIAVVICLSFAGIIALFIILKKKEHPSVAVSYYDENDYE